MNESSIVKIVAIMCLTVLESVNIALMHADGNVLLTIGAIIGGLAGYEFGKTRGVEKK